MANRTSWTPGNGQGLTYGSLFNGSDLASLPSGDAVASSVTAIANGTNLDTFMKVSAKFTISSTTPTAGSFVSLWIAYLNEDGTIYGDGNFPAGTQKAYQPAWAPVATVPLNNAAGAQTVLAVDFPVFMIEPRNFIAILGTGGSAPTLSATGTNCVVDYVTANVNLND